MATGFVDVSTQMADSCGAGAAALAGVNLPDTLRIQAINDLRELEQRFRAHGVTQARLAAACGRLARAENTGDDDTLIAASATAIAEMVTRSDT